MLSLVSVLMKTHRNQDWPLIFLAMAGGGEEQLSHLVIIKLIRSSRPTTPCAQKDHQNFFWKPKVKSPQASNKEAWLCFDDCLPIVLKKVLWNSSDATYFVISSMWKGKANLETCLKEPLFQTKQKTRGKSYSWPKNVAFWGSHGGKPRGKKGLGTWERSVKGFSTSR